jgi:hypothetical protein
MERVPRWRKPLLAVHIVVSVSLIGTTLVLAALGIASLRGDDPSTIYPAAYLIEARVAAPLALLALSTGLLLGLLTPWGILKHWWVSIKLATTVTFTVVVFAVLIPRLAASADVAVGPEAQSLTITDRLPLAIAPMVAMVFLLLNVTLAVFKPGRTLRSDVTAGTPLPRRSITGRPNSSG